MRIWAQESAGSPSRISERTTASLRPTTDSWERPDNGFADMVLATAAKGNAPDFEMPAGTGNDTGEVSSSGHPTSRNTTPATAPFRTPDDDERARQSPSFRSWRSPPTVAERASRKRSDCRDEQKNDAQTVPPTATPLHVDSASVPLSVQQSAPKS
jgi:hypothetical protein